MDAAEALRCAGQLLSDLFHFEGCACAACASAPEQKLGGSAASTSDNSTPRAPGSGQASKTVYSAEQVADALTTADGQYGSVAWTADTITYSINTGQLESDHVKYDREHAGYVEMTAMMEARAAEAFELWDDLIAIDLVRTEDDAFADVSFNYSSNTGGSTYAKYFYSSAAATDRADYSLTDTDIWFADDWWTHDESSDLFAGSYGILTYIHEIGHALGLSHPGQYNGSANFSTDATHFQDTRGYTTMSYFDADENGSGTDHRTSDGLQYGATPLLHDIMTVQAIYGADMTTRTDATTYGFNNTSGRSAFDFTKNTDPVVAIWDAGGIDTLDVSGFNTDQIVNLNEGAFSSVGHLTQNVAIAYGAIIENAVTGAGSDTLIGNEANNRLDGGAGADVLNGGAGFDLASYASSKTSVQIELGNLSTRTGDAVGDVYISIEGFVGTDFADRLIGDQGGNRLVGGARGDTLGGRGGRDTLYGEGGNDVLDGGKGNDTLWGGGQADKLIGWYNSDVLYGGNGNDVLLGGAQADELYGGNNNDILRGGNGTDLMYGDGQSDTLYGEADSDEMYGGNGNDTLWGGSQGDQLFGGNDHDVLHGEGGADSLDGGAGNDQLFGGYNTDTLNGGAGRDVLDGGGQNDRLDGGTGNDTLTGGNGADTFIFTRGSGVDTITDFRNNQDQIDLADFGLANIQAALDLAVQSGEDVIFDFGDGDQLVLRDTNLTDLNNDILI